MKNLPYYHYKTAAVTCSNCNWNGLGSQLKIGEHYSALFELDCPKCDHKVAMVGMPSFEEVLKDGTDKEKEEVLKSIEESERQKNLELTRASKLPKLSGPLQIRFHERYERHHKILLDIYANELLIFSEQVYYEYSERLMEIIRILSYKYRAKIQSIDYESTHDLCGDRFDAFKLKAVIEAVVKKYQTKAGKSEQL